MVGAVAVRTFSSTKLRNRRIAAGFTQVQAGAAVGVLQAAYSHWETGRNTPGFADVYALSVLFGCGMEDFLTDVPDGGL